MKMTNAWMPREKWDALVRGEDCPLCSVIAAKTLPADSDYFLADLSVSRMILVKNQYVKGYCLLICHQHVREPYELAAADQRKFFADLMLAGQSLEKAFGAIKMNFQMLGNAVPHLHCHLEPRYYGDAFPGHPADPNKETVILKPEEYRQRVAQMRRALNRIR
ncbi:MAG: HIT family protein [Dehalococcoidales bacterium]|jgi:diadenosine tetraphosphate (Ap4A) HIT family hydrolase